MNNSSSEAFLLKRRRSILKAVALVSLFLGSVSLFVDFLNLSGILKTQPDLNLKLFFLTVALLSTSASIAAYVLARRGQPQNVRVGAYIITITWTIILFGINLVFPNEIGLLIPMLCVGLLFSPREIVGWLISFVILDVSCNLANSFGLVATNSSNGASLTGQLIPSLLTLILTGGSFWYLQTNLKVISGEVNERIGELAQLSEDREQKRQVGLQVVQNMRQQATELSGVSLQQESGVSEQALAVTEITHIMEQLGSSARYVADSSRKAAEVAERTRNSAESVKAAAEKASETTLEGLTTTAEAGAAILRAQHQIRALEKRLEELVGQSSQISKIVDLMKELGDQTHLLALNAAIESAGAGKYGERFGVVADEVKNLADRSLVATRDVQQMISQLQQAVTEANSVAVEARHESEEAAERAERSGVVINELGRVIEINSRRAHEILEETLQVSSLMSEIADVTGDQRATTDQITDTMQAIGEVARENAGVTRQLNQAAARLEVLSSELTSALAEQKRAQAEAQQLIAA